MAIKSVENRESVFVTLEFAVGDHEVRRVAAERLKDGLAARRGGDRRSPSLEQLNESRRDRLVVLDQRNPATG